MKKLIYLLLPILAITYFSCEDDDEKLKVSFEKEGEVLKVGESKTYTFTWTPAGIEKPTVTWTSSDKAVATVTAEGKVTALKAGETTIKIAADKDGAVAEFNLEVTNVEITAINFTKDVTEVTIGDYEDIAHEILPANATIKKLTWTSADESIATVDANGEVTGVAVGETTITAVGGSITETTKVKVNPIEVERIVLAGPENNQAIAVGGTFQVEATIYPNNATNKALTWTSSNPQVGTVDENGLVSIKGVGATIITAKAGNEVKGEVSVSGMPGAPPPPPPPPSGVAK